jgi:cystathionine beta-lyase
VHLELPGRLGELVAGEGDFEVLVEAAYTRYPAHRIPPETRAVERALGALLHAERPVIVAGGGVTASDAGAELTALAERLDIPVAATKYVVGHSDVLIGTIACGPRAWKRVKTTHGDLGMFTGPDDMYLALRGLRTMGVRLAHQQKSALTVAAWFAARPEVARVLHPALPTDPGHAIWKRDFTGSSGLFGVVMKGGSEAAISAFLDHLDLFGLGYSWGGYESLAIPAEPRAVRTAVPWREEGALIRLQIGLEDTADLIADLEAGLARWNAALGA